MESLSNSHRIDFLNEWSGKQDFMKTGGDRVEDLGVLGCVFAHKYVCFFGNANSFF